MGLGIVFGVVLLIVVFLAIWAIGIYNNLITLRKTSTLSSGMNSAPTI